MTRPSPFRLRRLRQPPAPPAPPTPSGLPSRHAALELLDAVLDQGRPLDEAIETSMAGDLAALAPRDRAFARALVAQVLRRLGEIDGVIAAFLRTPLGRRQMKTTEILRLGMAELLFLDTPAHAAVSTAVSLAPAPHKGLVNAVLRRAAREGRAALDRLPATPGRRNTPSWLWESWARAYGAVIAEKIAARHLEEPPLDLSVKTDGEKWAAALGARILPSGTLRRPLGGRIEDLPGYAEGAWWVQDAAAALPARLLGPVGGRRVIDLCAAPGGKTAQLAAAGARVTAVERAPARLARLRDNLARLGLTADLVEADALDWRPAAPASLVLLDAPCTATGTIRRHPDIARLKTPEDMTSLAKLQDRLLAQAASYLAPGATLVYCVCSLEPEEGPERIAALLAKGWNLKRHPISPAELGGLDVTVTPEGDLRTLPSDLAAEGGVDGFYSARLVRAS